MKTKAFEGASRKVTSICVFRCFGVVDGRNVPNEGTRIQIKSSSVDS